MLKSIRKNRGALILAVGAAVALLAGPAWGATDTDNLAVTATVSANCTITTAAVAFGAYDPIVTHAAANLDAAGSVTVTCTDDASSTVTLGQGANADGGSTDAVPLRRMEAGGFYLDYFLYQDAPRTTVWGNTAGTGVDHTGTGNATVINVYGRVTSAQNVPAGNYSDTVVATVTF